MFKGLFTHLRLIPTTTMAVMMTIMMMMMMMISHLHPGMYPPRYRPLGPVPTSFSASLEVGSRRFHGEGPTEQAARHAAAQQALSLLRGLPPRPPPDPVPADLGEAPGDQLKSPVSLVHELALKRGLSVSFQVGVKLLRSLAYSVVMERNMVFPSSLAKVSKTAGKSQVEWYKVHLQLKSIEKTCVPKKSHVQGVPNKKCTGCSKQKFTVFSSPQK